MKIEALGTAYFVVPDGVGPHPGIVVIHEVYGLNENIRDICRRFGEQGYAALGVDLFAGPGRALCLARMLTSWATGNLNDGGVAELKAALEQLSLQPEVDRERLGAIGFCMGGFYATTWACTDNRLKAIAPYYGGAPRRKSALRRLCPVVGSWPADDYTSRAAATLEIELTAAGVPHDLKIYPGARHSFFNDRGANYHPAAASDSWERVLGFFREHVKGER